MELLLEEVLYLGVLEPRHTSCSLAVLQDRCLLFLPLCLFHHHGLYSSGTVSQNEPPFPYVAIVMVFYHSGRSKTNTHHFPVSCYMFFLCGVFSVSPSLSVNFGELSVPFPQCLVHTIPVFMGFLRAGSANRGFGFLIV